MNSRRICPADGSQYKQSAVGLVFMESAAGLAMETSKVESAVRNQAEAKLNQLEHSKPAGMMKTQLQALKRKDEPAGTCFEKSAEEIDRRRRFQSQKMKRRRAGESADGLALMTSSVTSSYSADGLREQSQESAAIAKRCRLHKLIRQRFALALKIQQILFALRFSSRKIPAGSICLIPAGQPDASNSSIQSRAYMNQLLLYIQSQALRIQSQRSRRKKRRSSEA
ncbi:hypothetical protein F511_15871 [Dorcoceras hygrometricum]|uniref:Uncharacterized protein n=1 Tax=Dorcoceras hygrometricum TaxID=472368 RepID=A0A2Z7BG70_9LAMI|nr:hypothetical protein F511_15871 [Dorcoceras hygrometricum]